MSEIMWAEQTWRLRADRTAYWVEGRSLVLADPHFGKAEHFRGSGVPVPRGTTRHNLERLDVALSATGAERLVVLGDFFHARGGVTDDLVEQLADWRARWDGLAVVNVRGNHDRSAGDPPEAVGVACVSGPWEDERGGGALALSHEPVDGAVVPTLCGHLHPAVLLEGAGKTRLRAACFWFGARCGVLPAFGAFTGMKVVRPRAGDRVFAVGPAEVTEVRLAGGVKLPGGRGGRRATASQRRALG